MYTAKQNGRIMEQVMTASTGRYCCKFKGHAWPLAS
jgi:hypothetical protein